MTSVNITNKGLKKVGFSSSEIPVGTYFDLSGDLYLCLRWLTGHDAEVWSYDTKRVEEFSTDTDPVYSVYESVNISLGPTKS